MECRKNATRLFIPQLGIMHKVLCDQFPITKASLTKGTHKDLPTVARSDIMY
jgi:hypothetical protein